MDLKGFSFSLNPSENNGALFFPHNPYLLLEVTTKVVYPCINNWPIDLTTTSFNFTGSLICVGAQVIRYAMNTIANTQQISFDSF